MTRDSQPEHAPLGIGDRLEALRATIDWLDSLVTNADVSRLRENKVAAQEWQWQLEYAQRNAVQLELSVRKDVECAELAEFSKRRHELATQAEKVLDALGIKDPGSC